MPDQVRVCGDEMRYKLPELCNIQYGYAFDSKKFTEDDTYPPLIRIRDVKRGYSETFYAGDYPQEYIVHAGDLLIGMDGEFNIARWNSRDALLNQRVCKITAKEGNNEEYIRFALSKVLKIIENKTSFVTVKHLSAKELNKIELSIPVELEQNKIACTLKNIENIINIRQRQLEKLSEIVRARFVEMFGDPKINPNHYLISQLSKYITFLTSGSRGWAKYCTDDGSEWFITIKNVKDCHILVDNMQPVNAPDNAEAKRTKVQKGDLLISITADLGRTGVVTGEIAEHGAYINQHLTCIRLNQTVLNPLYVSYFMESPAGKEQFESKNQSAVKAGLNFNSINSLLIMVPPIELQNQFADFVQVIDKSKDSVQKALDEAQLLFDSLMQQYFG